MGFVTVYRFLKVKSILILIFLLLLGFTVSIIKMMECIIFFFLLCSVLRKNHCTGLDLPFSLIFLLSCS